VPFHGDAGPFPVFVVRAAFRAFRAALPIPRRIFRFLAACHLEARRHSGALNAEIINPNDEPITQPACLPIF